MDDALDEQLFAEIERNNGYGMVTEWQVGPEPRALAFVACGADLSRVYEAAGPTMTSALSRAVQKARHDESAWT